MVWMTSKDRGLPNAAPFIRVLAVDSTGVPSGPGRHSPLRSITSRLTPIKGLTVSVRDAEKDLTRPELSSTEISAVIRL